MAFKNIRQVDRKLEKIIKSVMKVKGLRKFLESCDKWQERRKYLGDYVINHLEDYGLERVDWGLGYPDSVVGDIIPVGFLRNRFFYEMQQKTKMDFGFCPYFIPAYRERTKYLLEGEKGDPKKNWDKCTVSGTEMDALCEGTGRDTCVLLNSEKRK